MSTLTYKGFLGRFEFDADDGLFVGRLAGINDVVGFHGDTIASVTAAFEEAVDDYLATRLRSEQQRARAEEIATRASAKAADGPEAARSQDFLYDEFGLPSSG